MKQPVLLLTAALIFLFLSCNEQTTHKQQTAEIEYLVPVAFAPPTYICYKAPFPITIDGKLSPGEWDLIPWTSDFVDIQGDKKPKPFLKTQAKMTYDDYGLYIAAMLEEPHIWADLTQHDTVLVLNNNFEFFIDPSNDTHNYVEYEVNALGTTWDLFLSKPYRDEDWVLLNDWEFMGMKSAVHVEGTLNNPNDIDKFWSMEVFVPWKSIYQLVQGKKVKPEAGEQIRVNFARVEWATEVQDGKYVKAAYEGEDKIRERYFVWASMDEINMHKPENWGFVQFSDKLAGTGEESFVRHSDEDTKWILRNLYYRQRQFFRKFGVYASTLADLKPEEVCPAEILPQLILGTTMSMYEITLPTPNGRVWHIRQDGLVWSK